MSFDTCAVKVKKWFKENAEEIKMPDSAIETMARLLEASGKDALTPAQFEAKMEQALDEYGQRLAAKSRASRAQDLALTAKAANNVLANAQAWSSEGAVKRLDPGSAAVEAFRAHIEGGSLRPGQGTNISLLQTSRGLETSFLQTWRQALGDNELALQMADKADSLTRAIFQEKWAIENRLQLGQSGNEQALEIAKSMKVAQDRMLTEGQSVSPFLEQAKSFIAQRNHLQEAVVGDGSADAKARWVADAMKAFGEKSFVGNTPAEKIKIFGDLWDSIRSGEYYTPGFESNFWGVKGAGGDLARQLGAARTLLASDWQSEFEYASKYGDTLWNAMGNQIRYNADKIARISKWGSSPQANFQATYNAILKQLPTKAKAKFKNALPKFQDAFAVSMGSQNAPAQGIVARTVQGFQTLQALAKAGNHLPRSFNDFQNAVTLTRDMFGKNLIENTHEIASGVAKAFFNLPGAEERLADLGVFFTSTSRDFWRTMSGPDAQPGSTAKLGEFIGKLTLGDRQQASIKYATAQAFAKQMGELKDTAWGDLAPRTQQGLARYNIGENEWTVLRQSTQTLPFLEGQTRDLMTPEAIRQVPDEVAEWYLRKTGQWSKESAPPKQLLDRARYQTALNYSAMLNENASLAAANTDVRQRNFLYGDTTVNSGQGLFWRMVGQFKGAALTNSDIVRRSYFSGDGSKSNISGLAQHLAMGAFYSVLGDYLIQAATGKTLKSPTDPEMIARATIGSGAGGIWADGLINALQQKDKSGMIAGAAESFLGPTISTLGETGLAAAGAAKGAIKQASGNSRASLQGKWFAHLVQTNTPGQNIFYLKAGYDYFLMNELHEMLGGSGYLDALQRQMKQSGQDFTFGGQNFWRK